MTGKSSRILINNSLYFRNFEKSNNSVPKLSYIPTCFFGEQSAKYWDTGDYTELQYDNDISKEAFQENLKLHESDFYRYPKCRSFHSIPTDSGICKTFNGLELKVEV